MKKEDFIIDEWVIWINSVNDFYYLLIKNIDNDYIHYSEFINVDTKKHNFGNGVYYLNAIELKGLVDISEVQKYLPIIHPHHNKFTIKQVDDLEPLLKLLKNINNE